MLALRADSWYYAGMLRWRVRARKLTLSAAVFGTVLSVASPAFAQGDSLIQADATIAQNLQKVYETSVPIILTLAFLVTVYAGYLYITSLGNPEAVSEAKNWFIAAIVGSALILLMPLIIQFLGTPTPTS